MGSPFREVLQKQLELLTRVLNEQHELELHKLRSDGVTLRSEHCLPSLSAEVGGNLRLQKICDVELEPIHMLRDGHRNEHVPLQIEDVQSLEPDRSDSRTAIKSFDYHGDELQNGTACEPREPPPVLPDVDEMGLSSGASAVGTIHSANSTSSELAAAEETILKMKNELMMSQVEISELQSELQEARVNIQNPDAKSVSSRRQSRFGVSPAHGNPRPDRVSVIRERPDSQASVHSSVTFAARRDKQTIQFDPSVSEEPLNREESLKGGKSQGVRMSSAACFRSIGSTRAGPSSAAKRKPAPNRNLSVVATPAVAFAPQTSTKNLAPSRSISKFRKATEFNVPTVPDVAFSCRESEDTFMGDESDLMLLQAEDEPSALQVPGILDKGPRHSNCSAVTVPGSARSSNVIRDDEAELEVLPGWEHHGKLVRSMTKADNVDRVQSAKETASMTTASLARLPSGKWEADAPKPFFLNDFVLNPKSKVRLTWDVLGISFTTYDAFIIPLAFLDLVENAFTITMAWMTRLFWTFDIFWSCMTGYNTDNGDLEMRIMPIIRRYLRTWFFFDLLLVCADWMQELLTEGLSTAGRMGKGGKIARIARILRLARLLRAARLKYVIASWFENINISEQIAIVSSISIAMFGIICAIHFTACVWYGIGVSSNENWAIVHRVSEEAFWSRYAHSLFWATGQFTGGVDPEPLNDEERFFIIFVMILAFLIATCFVSSFTSSLTQFQIISSTQTAQFQVLKRYMRQHNISTKLSIRVTRNAKHVRSEKQRKTPEEDVELLKLVSEPLRVEMHFEMYFPTLALHPLFQRYCEEMNHSMRKVCHNALCLLSFSAGDILFSNGEEPAARDMLFVIDGEFDYLHPCFVDKPSICTVDDDTFDKGSDTFEKGSELVLQETRVVAGHWVCEPVIWTSSWLYCGTLRATHDSSVLVLDGVAFMDIASKTHNPCFDVANYAKEYVKELRHLTSRVSDLGTVIDSDALVTRCYGRRLRPSKNKSVIQQLKGGVRQTIG